MLHFEICQKRFVERIREKRKRKQIRNPRIFDLVGKSLSDKKSIEQPKLIATITLDTSI